jgi:magnesium-transporting ATPase (P-type)
MSVLIHDVASDKYYIFVKGAPEKIQRVSNNKVADFDKLLSDVSLAGLRCLGVGFREVEKPD